MMTTALTVLAAGILLTVIFSSILALPVMLLWDAVIPTIFGLPEITWFQAWCLMMLCALLFRPSTVEAKV